MKIASVGERYLPVMIQQRPSTDVADSSGAPNDDGQWTTLAKTVYMQRLTSTGDERLQSAEVSAPFTTVWQMPYRRDMDPDQINDFAKVRRLKVYNRIYDITTGSVLGLNEAIAIETIARQG